ncbi:MAG: sigma 54-interacting transcriptional regulator [Deltaproteobacteria bacterium]|nr:sigma 54-interacting transcriptional regulator [Deltaproteobacteria bacterium]
MSPSDLPTVTLASGTQTLAFPKVRLKVLKGPDKGTAVTLDRDEILIGSAEGAHLKLTDPTVSRNHCVIRLTPKGPLLRDLGSTNGTRVEGVELREGYVPPGACLELGNTRVRFEPLDESVQIPLAQSERFGRLLGRSAAMRRLFAQAGNVAASNVTVLIEGETGTGKDALAESIHQASPRANGPLVVVDCGAVPPNLFESELFGHEKGAFTGADRARAGAFEEADGGTLFLDEIGELPLLLQPKLLRVLEAREVRRLGSVQPRKIDVRVVAATNRDLREEVNRGTFRQDLYYRLEVMRLRVPPLRERPEDIPVLAEHFRRLARSGADVPAISEEALRTFQAHPWPGNVRELRNAVERLVVLQELPLAAQAPASEPANGEICIDVKVPFKDAKNALTEAFERRYLKAMLEATCGNISEAARRAGIDRVYLLKLLGRYGLRKGPATG